MKTITVERVLLAIIAVVMLLNILSMTKVVEEQQKCMVALAKDLLNGNIVGSQVTCSRVMK